MRSLWRISNHQDLSGQGGLRTSARWHHAGRPIVYLADSPAGALLEVLVHLELEQTQLPRTHTLLHVQAPEELSIHSIEPKSAPRWEADRSITRNLGDQWLTSSHTALARVPSAILPSTVNYLLNPLHPDAKQVLLTEAVSSPFDPRLFTHLRGA